MKEFKRLDSTYCVFTNKGFRNLHFPENLISWDIGNDLEMAKFLRDYSEYLLALSKEIVKL